MKRAIILLAAALLLLSCAPKPRLVILHVNDTHSHLEPVRSGKYKGRGGAIERAAFVDSVRHAFGEDKVLLLHAGDFNQGTSYFSELGGEVELQVVNAFRYDCIALGNHEFDNGIEDLAGRLARLDGIPVVCANLDLTPFELGKYVKPYTVLQRGGLKIGIVGLITNISTNVSSTISSRIPQLEPVATAQKYVDLLRTDEKCDMVILLSHCGYREDQEIIAAMHGVDLVVGGHSHTFVDDFIRVKDADGRDVPIIQDGCWGEDVGMIKIY